MKRRNVPAKRLKWPLLRQSAFIWKRRNLPTRRLKKLQPARRRNVAAWKHVGLKCSDSRQSGLSRSEMRTRESRA